MMHNNEYYFENSFAILLNHATEERLSKEADKLKCKECGAPIALMQMFEGPFLFCTAGLYNKHKLGYDLHMDFPRYEKEPYIEKL
jgi:hypothetical protein